MGKLFQLSSYTLSPDPLFPPPQLLFQERWTTKPSPSHEDTQVIKEQISEQPEYC